MNPRNYRFVSTDSCNMCGSGADDQVLIGRRLDRRQGYRPRTRPGITVSIVCCRRCALIYPNPMPLPERVEQHYDVRPEDYWTDDYFRVDEAYLGHQIEGFTRLTGHVPRGCSALDIGAGIGKAIVALDHAGFETQGIEPSASFRRAAVERLGVGEAQIQTVAIEEAQFPDDSFDFINFGAVLEHLADPAAALVKTVGWLKPEGVMYVEVPSSAFLLSRLARIYYRLTGSDFVINTCPMHVPYHLYEFGLESFRRHGSRTRYSVVFHQYFACADYILKPLIKPFNALMRWTNTGMQLAVWIKKHH